ncbi:MAG: twin-arginine translocase TatA/TatE family subunit [Sphingomonadales bacterium]|nr:twin-arginine translocase TatA/TatE family subunit [Sphingomonadales bacterium]MDE2168309.1 twin-arginine translocase TatA/TatE family subunit [Sphingomonadales bacterium]
MMGLSLPHLLVVALVVLVLFGKGRISEMMGDFGKGIKSFKDGMNEDDKPKTVTPPAQITQAPAAPVVEPAKTPSETGAGQ